jgi:hypothetical protein
MATASTNDGKTVKAATAEQAEVIAKNRDSLPAVDAETAERDRLALENAQATAQAEADATVQAAEAKLDAAKAELKAATDAAKNVEAGLDLAQRGRLAHDRNAV